MTMSADWRPFCHNGVRACNGRRTRDGNGKMILLSCCDECYFRKERKE